MPQEEADSLCDSFAQRCSPENLHKDTINKLTLMAPVSVRTITTAASEPVDTDEEFTTLSDQEYALYRLNDTAPADDTVCYSMNKNAPLATRNLFLGLINQLFTQGRLPTKWKDYTDHKDRQNTSSHLLLPTFSKVVE